eukprot:511602-Pyramimonas_sp.AAC.1
MTASKFAQQYAGVDSMFGEIADGDAVAERVGKLLDDSWGRAITPALLPLRLIDAVREYM